MPEAEISPDELIQFEMAIIKELGKRGFEMLLTGDTINFMDTKSSRKGTADLAQFYRQYKEGRKIEEIAGQITAMAAEPAQAAAPAPQQTSAPKLALNPDRIYPIVRGPEFVNAYMRAVENRFGKGLPADHPSIPKFFQYASGREAYIFCGFDIEGRRQFINNAIFRELNMGDMDLFRKMMQNLGFVIEMIIREKRYRFEKQADGSFSIMLPEDLTPSFLLLANRNFDWLEEMTGIRGAKFFYAFTVSEGEVAICGPSSTKEELERVVAGIIQKQVEISKRTDGPNLVRIEPLVITREGLSFLNPPKQPSPKR